VTRADFRGISLNVSAATSASSDAEQSRQLANWTKRGKQAGKSGLVLTWSHVGEKPAKPAIALRPKMQGCQTLPTGWTRRSHEGESRREQS
jgi:hypothetical protein